MKCLFVLLTLISFSSTIHAAEVRHARDTKEECEAYLTHLKMHFTPTANALKVFKNIQLSFRRSDGDLNRRPMTELEREAFLIPPGADYDVNSLTIRITTAGDLEAKIQAWRGRELLGERELDFRDARYGLVHLANSPDYFELFDHPLTVEDMRYLMHKDLRTVVPIAQVGRHQLTFFFTIYPEGNLLWAVPRIELVLIRDCVVTDEIRLRGFTTAMFLNERLQCLTPIAFMSPSGLI